MNNIKILSYGTIDVFERTDINKASASKEYDICHYWYFLNKGFKIQPSVRNKFHDLLVMSINLCDIAILNNKDSDYCCIISGISKSEAIKLLESIDVTEKTRTS